MPNKFPEWLKVRVGASPKLGRTSELLKRHGLTTVCECAACPNLGHCWDVGHATIMILGDRCTRRCKFCNVEKDGGIPCPVEADEPQRVAKAVAEATLREVVLTSVTRDDLSDGGAAHWAKCVELLHALPTPPTVEVLTPDFKGKREDVATVLAAKPEVFSHNLETVPRLYETARPQANYRRSLDVLRQAADSGFIVKTALMLGLGETEEELISLFADAADAGVKILFMGQYLRPTPAHLAVETFIHPTKFDELADAARQAGIELVRAAPLLRSSYHDDEQTKFVEKKMKGA